MRLFKNSLPIEEIRVMPKKELDARIQARVRAIKRENKQQAAMAKKSPKLKGAGRASLSDLD